MFNREEKSSPFDRNIPSDSDNLGSIWTRNVVSGQSGPATFNDSGTPEELSAQRLDPRRRATCLKSLWYREEKRGTRSLPRSSAVRFLAHGHFRGGDRHPLVGVRTEPGQSQRVFAVKVGVLAATEPPSAVIIGGAVGRAGVHVAILGAEGHTVLIRQSVRRVPQITVNVHSVTGGCRVDGERLVLGAPTFTVDVQHVDAKPGAFVARESVEDLVADPVLANR